MRAKPWHVALACTAVAIAWQWMVATGYFQGHWSAFFYTGSRFAQSPAVKAEGAYVFPNSYGYDGQLYHASAHDPLDLHGTDRFMDAARMRYGRILVPALSYLLGFGRLFWIDRAYRGLELAFLFLGVACLAVYLERRGRSCWWAATFLLVPGVFISLERQLTDLPLCALIVAAMVAFERGNRKLCWLALAGACLDRDTGIVAIGALAAASMWERRFRDAALWITAAVPQLLWTIYLRFAIPKPDMLPSWGYPFQSIITALGDLQPYPSFAPLTVTALHVLDVVAIAGAVLASGYGIWIWIQEKTPLTWMAGVYGLFGVVVSGSAGMEYRDVYGFGRVLSPLLLALLIQAICARDPRLTAPLALMLPRAVLLVGMITLVAIKHLVLGPL